MPLHRAASHTAIAGAPRSMTFGMHQFTSAGAGYRGSLEGWARAGVRQVEPASDLFDNFLKTETLATAKRVIADLNLTVVSAATNVTGLWEPNPNFAANLDTFRRRCEQFAELGAPLVYSPCAAQRRIHADDYPRALDNVRRVAGTASDFGLKVAAEFVRNSSFLAALPTALLFKREAAHPSFGILFDCYHFWSGPSKMEDLDLIQPGEIIHVHVNDTPRMARESLDLRTRVIPGDGVAPLAEILQRLRERGYAGPASVELFLPEYQNADPSSLATEIKRKTQPLLETRRR
jgi:2-keto-myo-inositol isomerase